MIKLDSYRDGGTELFLYKNENYALDYRLDSSTKNQWYLGYPKRDNSNLITDSFLVDELTNALKIIKNE